MKKKIFALCMSAILSIGSTSAFAANFELQETVHIYTADIGTTRFAKDGVLQPLDVTIDIQDGYVMLPMRTFLCAVYKDADMDWDAKTKTATVMMDESIITFDANKNTITRNGEPLKVSGTCTVKEGRLFVPLRNWGNILAACGYAVTPSDITWNDKTKQATIKVGETTIVRTSKPKDPVFTGEGEPPIYTMALTEKYDELSPIGDGLFLAQQYPDGNIGLGIITGGPENTYAVIDATGKELLHFDRNTLFLMDSLGEGYFYAISADFKKKFVMNQTGETLFDVPYQKIGKFSDGLSLVAQKVDETIKYGYINTKGELQIPLQFTQAAPFSEGLAAVSGPNGKYGFIDTKGNFVIEPTYDFCHSFHEGLAGVKTAQGLGYINQKGETVIDLQYLRIGTFHNGTSYAMLPESHEVWLINTKGERLKRITEAKEIFYANKQNQNSILCTEEIVQLPNGAHEHISSWFDETGEISYQTYLWKKDLAEGLSPVVDATNKKYGYVDDNGKWIISSEFDYAEAFQDGYAVVACEYTTEQGTQNVAWGIIQNPLQ